MLRDSDIHSTAISNVAIHKNGDSRNLTGNMDPGETTASPFIDKKLLIGNEKTASPRRAESSSLKSSP